jgi:hypothetical protein
MKSDESSISKVSRLAAGSEMPLPFQTEDGKDFKAQGL